MAIFKVFENLKKSFFDDIFRRIGPMDVLIGGKKTYDVKVFSPQLCISNLKNLKSYQTFESGHFF